MGHVTSIFSRPNNNVEVRGSLLNFVSTTTAKRSIPEDGDSNISGVNPPKRRRLKSTTEYIYEKLFLEQKHSDVTISALDKTWNLHKIYLCQSPYFQCMFNGGWKETDEKTITIEINDENITLQALDAVLGSLYSDEIDIDQNNVVPVLATGTLFQLAKVIERCAEVMIETSKATNIIEYYEAANRYGLSIIKRYCFEWLENNMYFLYNKDKTYMSKLCPELMTAIISSQTFLDSTEDGVFSLYILLRNWLYLKVFPYFNVRESTSLDVQSAAESFFKLRVGQKAFLSTEDGCKYDLPFRAAIIVNRFTDEDLELMAQDNIVTKEWLLST